MLNAFATVGSFYELAGTLYREAFWLVSDHLGTPRMIVDKSGTLASVKRHMMRTPKNPLCILRSKALRGTYLAFGSHDCSIAGESEHSHKLFKDLRCG
ncbi:MAG TPA: hypothetical protein VGJ48_19025 [Pyrinomonadaceae bacterium]